VNLGPGRDALWLANADVLYSLGFEDRATKYYQRLEETGSRNADVYYSLATLAAIDNKEDAAEQYLRKAWDMQPIERATLIGTGVFWSTLRRPGMLEKISLSAADEPLVTAAARSTRPAVLPPDAQPRTTGELLEITIGDRQLRVPGGAAIAPPNTPVVGAAASAAAEVAQRLADFDTLLTTGTTAAAYAQPALRERITGTANALATHNRWSDLVRLTEGLSPASEHVPSDIFFLRSVGLQRMNRSDEAKRLLAQVAVSPVLQRRRDANALAQLAELFAAHDMFDAAVRMYDRSQSIRANGFIDDRVRQIQMNKHLATKYSTHRTKNFEIHFPEEISVSSAASLGEVAEREFTRLQTWIPVPNFKPVVVNVLWWEDFRSTYTGSDFILGFYNGKITVPFAGVSSDDPMLVNILAHELSHAMIAQATADQAPRWFQEGFAQRIEERPHHTNAFNMYDDAKLVPLSLLDAVLGGSPDPEMIGAAYIIAQTDIRFIEARYGRGALQKLMNAFRDGATTEEAIRRVCGKSLAEFEHELRQWGRSGNHVFGGGV
jgi:tetratricopeptide (TPR) repeat protein